MKTTNQPATSQGDDVNSSASTKQAPTDGSASHRTSNYFALLSVLIAVWVLFLFAGAYYEKVQSEPLGDDALRQQIAALTPETQECAAAEIWASATHEPVSLKELKAIAQQCDLKRMAKLQREMAGSMGKHQTHPDHSASR